MRKGRRRLTVHISGFRQGEIYSVSIQNDKTDYYRIYDRHPFDDKLPLSDTSVERIKRLVTGRAAVWGMQDFADVGDRIFNHTVLVYEWLDPRPVFEVRTITVNRWYEGPTEIVIENRRGDRVEYKDITSSSMYRIECLLKGMTITNTYLTNGVVSITAQYKGE